MKSKSFVQQSSICAALIFVVLISGCVAGPKVRTYSGDKIQKSEVAVIKGWCFFTLLGYECIDIYSIDDAVLKATNVEVLPGMHDLEIRWYTSSLLTPINERSTRLYEFNFEAGHEYKIKAHFEGIRQIGADIIDVTTGAIVTRLWYWYPNWYPTDK